MWYGQDETNRKKEYKRIKKINSNIWIDYKQNILIQFFILKLILKIDSLNKLIKLIILKQNINLNNRLINNSISILNRRVNIKIDFIVLYSLKMMNRIKHMLTNI